MSLKGLSNRDVLLLDLFELSSELGIRRCKSIGIPDKLVLHAFSVPALKFFRSLALEVSCQARDH